MEPASSTTSGVNIKRRPSHFPKPSKGGQFRERFKPRIILKFYAALDLKFLRTATREFEPELGGSLESALWTGEIDDQFLTGVSPFGGYIVSIILESTRREVRRLGIDKRFPEPVSCSAVFLEGGRPAPFLAILTPRRIGGRFAVFDVVIRQELPPKAGTPGPSYATLVTANVTMSDLASERGTTTILANDNRTPITSPFDPPALPFNTTLSMSTADVSEEPVGLGFPKRSDCVPRAKVPAGYVSPRTGLSFNHFMDTLDQPHVKEDLKTAERGANWAKWVRWNTGDIQDTPSLGFMSDLYGNPIMFEDRPKEGRIWMPTMDYHLQIRAIPDPSVEWILINSRNKFTTNGRREFDVEIWDETGKLLAVARYGGLNTGNLNFTLS
ncbi:hypothetical protein HDU93_006475 [Gonapodya sp. JEL0774]|nr:hypothetical protein HDU93_006475 [Gonapodya sp. JEL0774]